jgi:hypothetical protein
MGLEWGGENRPPTDREVLILVGLMFVAVILLAVFK